MFYCEPCRVKQQWPEGLTGSNGICEVCGERASCYDVPSSRLPDPPEPKFVPEPVRERTRQAWGGGSKAGRHHAAKQLACWLLDNTQVKHQDENAQVDYLLTLGMAAEVQYDANRLIEYFENEILGAWCGGGRKKR